MCLGNFLYCVSIMYDVVIYDLTLFFSLRSVKFLYPVIQTTEDDVDVDDVLAEDTEVLDF